MDNSGDCCLIGEQKASIGIDKEVTFKRAFFYLVYPLFLNIVLICMNKFRHGKTYMSVESLREVHHRIFAPYWKLF